MLPAQNIHELPQEVDFDHTDTRVRAFLDKYCPRVIDGAQALADFMSTTSA